MPKVNISKTNKLQKKSGLNNREKILDLLREKAHINEYSFNGWEDILGSLDETITDEEAKRIFSKIKSPLSDDIIKDRGKY